MRELTYAQALREAMTLEMRRDEDVFLMGEDIGQLGGVFRITDGLQKDFGEDRVLDSPLAESGIVMPKDWTWDEAISMARKLTKDTNADGQTDIWGLALSELTQAYTFGDNFYTPDLRKTTINNPGTIAGVQLYAVESAESAVLSGELAVLVLKLRELERFQQRRRNGQPEVLGRPLQRRRPIEPEKPLRSTVGPGQTPPVDRGRLAPTLVIPISTHRGFQQRHTLDGMGQVAGEDEHERGPGRPGQGSQAGDQGSRRSAEGRFFAHQEHPLGDRPEAHHHPADRLNSGIHRHTVPRQRRLCPHD